jgi:hypothetical protein
MCGLAREQFNSTETELVDFKVESEDWQYYSLSDGSKLKIKLVLTQVLRSREEVNEHGEPVYSWNAPAFLSIVSFSEKLRGQPTNRSVTPERVADSLDSDVDFEKLGEREMWNVYSLSDGSELQLKLKINAIARTKLKGQGGEPIYTVATGMPGYKIKVASNLVKKPRSNIRT